MQQKQNEEVMSFANRKKIKRRIFRVNRNKLIETMQTESDFATADKLPCVQQPAISKAVYI